MEFELLDSGVFDEDATSTSSSSTRRRPDDICIRDRGVQPRAAGARLHVLPQLWFRNTWGWGAGARRSPSITRRPSATASSR
jgi:hypothetical protein